MHTPVVLSGIKTVISPHAQDGHCTIVIKCISLCDTQEMRLAYALTNANNFNKQKAVWYSVILLIP